MKIVVLGNVGTYCDIAAKKYISENNIDAEIVYQPTIVEMIKELKNCDLGVFPFENCLSGFVMDSLYGIIENNYKIVHQIQLDVDFAFVSNAEKFEKIKNIYSQFKVHGQCQKFIAKHNFSNISTQSNTETLEKINSDSKNFGAIIPMHLLDESKFNIVEKHVADNLQNKTRFFVLEKNENFDFENLLCSFVLKPNNINIVDVLNEIKLLDIDIFSIVSIPTKTKLMNYKYFVECDLKNNSENKIEKVKGILKDKCQLELLGIYNKLE